MGEAVAARNECRCHVGVGVKLPILCNAPRAQTAERVFLFVLLPRLGKSHTAAKTPSNHQKSHSCRPVSRR